MTPRTLGDRLALDEVSFNVAPGGHRAAGAHTGRQDDAGVDHARAVESGPR
jgi:hypothetical protein